jgi:hypothetical protein
MDKKIRLNHYYQSTFNLQYKPMSTRRGSVDRGDRRRRRNDCIDERSEYEEPMSTTYEHRERCLPVNRLDEPEGIYGAFYKLIYAFVYAILSFIMAPVIKSSSRSRRSHPQSCGKPPEHNGHERHNEFQQVEEGYSKPHYCEADSLAHQSIIRETPSKKAVQFTSQRKTYRPPLGRIHLNKSSNSSVFSGSTTTTTTSSSSPESTQTGGFGHFPSSYTVHSSLDRILAVSTPRTTHSSYFVGKY